MIALAQNAPPTLPPRPLPKIVLPAGKHAPVETRTFWIGGKEYRSVLAAKEDKSFRAWNSASPLPIGLARAEEIARGELAKLVDDAGAWQVSDFRISRFATEHYWYMSVTFEPATQVVSDPLPPDSFTVLLDFGGKPGRIFRVESQK